MTTIGCSRHTGLHAGYNSSNNGAATYAFTQAIQHHKGVWGFDNV
jgi:hypothetical protein